MGILAFIASLFGSPPPACPPINIVCEGYRGKAECPLQVLENEAVFIDRETGTTMEFTNDCKIN